MSWKELTDGVFKGFVFHEALPEDKNRAHGISREEKSQKRRLQLIKRSQVDGVEINDHGADEKTINVEIVFHGINYLKDYEEFIKICSDGKPGILTCATLKQSIVAYYAGETASSEFSKSNVKSVRISFIEDTSIDPFEIEPKSSVPTANVQKKKNLLQRAIASTKSVLKDNAFLKAVRAVESGLSTVRRYSNAVLTLEEGVRNRIAAIQENIFGTLSLLDDALAIFKATEDKIQAGILDEDTGQEVIPFDEEEEVEEEEINSVIPDELPERSSRKMSSNASAELFTSKVENLIKSQKAEMLSLTTGELPDVEKSINELLISIADFKASISSDIKKTIIIENEISLVEVMFMNKIHHERLNEIHKKNTHLTNLLVIDKGMVINL